MGAATRVRRSDLVSCAGHARTARQRTLTATAACWGGGRGAGRRSDGAGGADAATATATAAEHDSGQYTNVPFHSFAVRVPARSIDPVDKRLSNRVLTRPLPHPHAGA